MAELNTLATLLADATAYYRMESGVLTTDTTANARTLTNNNTVTSGAGIWGGGGSFVGASSQHFQRYVLGTTDVMGIGQGIFSFAGWFNGTGNLIKWERYDGTNYSGTDIGYSSSNLSIRRDASGGTVSDDYSVSLSGWHHFALTLDTTLKGYLDGVEVDSVTSSNSGRAGGNSNNFLIGAGNYGAFNGLMDDVCTFNKELSVAEILSLASLPPSGGNVMFFGGGVTIG